jgi:catechol 2,3-dioxygenase-like lactoylglutathione lyase family enzyme
MTNTAIDLGTSGKGVAFVYAADQGRALGFYRDTLGLKVVDSDPYGAFLELPGALLRLTAVSDFKPHAHPVLGFEVADIAATMAALRERGVSFDIFDGMGQDEHGVWTSPDGGKMSFFKDVEGNALMLQTQATAS